MSADKKANLVQLLADLERELITLDKEIAKTERQRAQVDYDMKVWLDTKKKVKESIQLTRNVLWQMDSVGDPVRITKPVTV